MVYAGGAQNDVIQLANNSVSTREARARRQLDNGDQVSDVLFRDKAGRHPSKLEARQRYQADINNEDESRRPDEAGCHLGVPGRHPLEASVEATKEGLQNPVEASRLVMSVVRLQENRGQRRAQGQRDEAGDNRRGGDGGRELLEEQSRDAGDERRGDKDSAKR